MNKKNKNRVLVTNDDPHFPVRSKIASEIALTALAYLGYRKTQLSLVFTSDAKIKKINRQFLKHNWPTDVLAFPGPKGTSHLGEVIISPKRAFVQAPLFDASFQEELARYVCHGICHLSGFKDKTKSDRAKMRRKEDAILKLCKRTVKRIISHGH